MISQLKIQIFTLLAMLPLFVTAQTIKGEVLDKETHKPIAGVKILDIHTLLEVTSSEDGSFIIATGPDHLIEFKKNGYKPARARIPIGYSPNYYRIILEHGFDKKSQNENLPKGRYDYHDDSLKYATLYQKQLGVQKMSPVEIAAHPFSALSKDYRAAQKFQKEYNYYEHEKYVDKTFSKELIERYTGLKGDSLDYYVKRYRPSYDDLIEMNDYNFYNYIKRTVARYREGERSRGAQ